MHLQLHRAKFVPSCLILGALFCSCSSSTAPVEDRSGDVTDSRDGKSYKVVTIGRQTWMAQNLNYRNASGSSDTLGLCTSWDPANCNAYGRLYTWAEAMGIDTSFNSKYWSGADSLQKGICPTGWHLPSKAEWDTLKAFAGDSSGAKLKSATGWITGYNGVDRYGFGALPGGSRNASGSFVSAGYSCNWWASTKGSSAATAYQYYLLGGDKGDAVSLDRVNMYYGGASNRYAFFVRCLKN